MPVSAHALFTWHALPGAFERLTPPWEPIEVLERSGPPGIEVGARVEVRFQMGPVPRRLVAEHTRYEPDVLFQDVQRSGPFASWVHTHRMHPTGPESSELEDHIEYALPAGPLGRVVGGGLARRQLERMFAYRHAITRADLQRHLAFSAQGPLCVAVSGASGLIGSQLTAFLGGGGHEVRRLVRGSAGPGEVAWDVDRQMVDGEALEGVDAVVHLAGASIADGRWSEERKEAIRRSRVVGTRVLCETLARMRRRPRVLVCGSAVGFYGSRGDEVLTEASGPGSDFLAEVVREWEAATAPAREAGIRVVHLRTGMVLSPRGGALAKLLPAFRFGAGGRVGSGQQWVSWVSIEDVLGMVQHALYDERLHGPLNAVAPEPVRQVELARTLAHVLHRPSVAPLPALAVRAAFGEMGKGLLLASQRAVPEVALAQGFQFLHPELEGALRFLLGR
ncbi:TIGR01777 family oxidoreductase [Aggregicoccus sp. 17bor-14]|uniref:TIGR01777 family oxidoreductase n=1 Tax=Myxococcaceae TaxID=31 RepID=UPI00351A3F9E